MNLIIGGDIPSDKRMKGFDYKKIRPMLRVGVEGVVV